MLISICMIVRNEEAVLERALRSIPSSYEIIVVDTGSTDRTVDISEKFGAKVYLSEWKDSFSIARNESISKATGEYILILDADEVLAPGTDLEIGRYIQQYPKSAGTVIIENEIDQEIQQHRMVRFFPNGMQYSFRGTVHETLYNNNDQLVDYTNSDIRIRHYGYQLELYTSGQKTERYLHLYEQHLNEHPQDGYMLYQVGKLHYSIGNLKEAFYALSQCLELHEADRLYFPPMLVMLGYVLKELGQSKLAEELLIPLQPQYPQFPDLPFLLGLISMDTANLKNIEGYFLKAIEIGETSKYTTVHGVGSYKAAYNLGVYYELTGNGEEALRQYEHAASCNYAPAKKRLSKIS